MAKVLIIAGPSAVGKSTLAEELLRLYPSFTLLRSATTRPPRGDGKDGEYIYLTREEFLTAVERCEMLEHTEYSGTLYGTPRSEVVRASEEGRTPLLILDLEGVRSFSLAEGISPCSLYVYSELEVMRSRLSERFVESGSFPDGERRLAERLAANLCDYSRIESYADCFYDFVKNVGTPTETAKRLLLAFSDFEGGVPRNGENISTALSEISRDLAENADKCK